ncbi:sensor domain-containing diguanylate cyclase [Acetobacterium woodii]|uniref:Putative response regulator pleD n=1 Tax=Acetobacterium woodii (strain ATCC 29683 / DSM 1030 / JCM 2381 / KCTC 1655 / WB1) TaxID=931626 RepID=H6LJA8_ACEWD|nr:GGDEF domain-containing protein [Acetobacterium woodii]AFA48671.1 putative response regulator pleD [Acetobacterium woodii DSM 1030]
MRIWNKRNVINSLITVIILVALYIISLNNYLLFHTSAEIFSICIAVTIFLIVINSQEFIDNNFLIIIGIAYLFIGFLDLLHALSYVGMNIFTDYDYYANQLWIATRFMESITLVIAFIFMNYKRKLNTNLIFITYFIATIAIVLSIFYWKIFPICFIVGEGQTKFKIISEYIISFILLISLTLSYINRKRFDKTLYKYVVFSIIFTIFSELAFTFYISNYGLLNILGHFFKILSFYLIYKAIIEKAIKEPQKAIFTELQNQVNTDGLTSLFNHRYLYDQLEAEITYTFQTKKTFSIIIFDIDHFKKVNDRYGHVIGDKVLLSVGTIITKLTRSIDTVGRYGGEEFMVILPNTGIENCYHIAEKIRIEIEKTDFCQKGINITVSAGIAQFDNPSIGEKYERISILANDFVNIADVNLYNAKSNGRNMTIGLK